MIRFYNGKILTLADGFNISEGEVWVDKDKISFVGKPTSDILDSQRFEREIDLEGNLLMPSFKDAHTHSAMTFLRSYADDMPLQDWLTKQVFPMEAKLTGEHIYAFTKLAILEYLSSGITASFDMYFKLDDYVRANLDAGFRTVICSSTNDFGGSPEQDEDDYLRFNSISPLISYKFGCHAEYTTKLETIKGIAKLCQKYKEPFYSHNSETEREVLECISRYNKTPTELFDDLGLYEYGGGGFHCVYLSENDMNIFKEKGLWAITNPGSNTKLASGVADISKMLDMGINIAIGTDGAASNNALDMFREMYLVTGLQKIKYMDASICPANDVLYMATAGSAKAMGLENCDTIEAGKQADLVVIDLNKPNMQPVHNITKNIVFSGSKQNVKLTMCAGKILYHHGVYYLDETEQDIYKRANEMLKDF